MDKSKKNKEIKSNFHSFTMPYELTDTIWFTSWNKLINSFLDNRQISFNMKIPHILKYLSEICFFFQKIILSCQKIKITFFRQGCNEAFKIFQMKYHSSYLIYSILRDWSAPLKDSMIKYAWKDVFQKKSSVLFRDIFPYIMG